MVSMETDFLTTFAAFDALAKVLKFSGAEVHHHCLLCVSTQLHCSLYFCDTPFAAWCDATGAQWWPTRRHMVTGCLIYTCFQ